MPYKVKLAFGNKVRLLLLRDWEEFTFIPGWEYYRTLCTLTKESLSTYFSCPKSILMDIKSYITRENFHKLQAPLWSPTWIPPCLFSLPLVYTLLAVSLAQTSQRIIPRPPVSARRDQAIVLVHVSPKPVAFLRSKPRATSHEPRATSHEPRATSLLNEWFSAFLLFLRFLIKNCFVLLGVLEFWMYAGSLESSQEATIRFSRDLQTSLVHP